MRDARGTSKRGRPVVAIVTRIPRAGSVKTRLGPSLGPQGAADLHRELAAHCVARMMPLRATGEARLEVHIEGGTPSAARRWLGRGPRYVQQAEGDLGNRLRAVLRQAVASGASEAVVLGSDCPGARAAHVRTALAELETSDVVLGPAEDGGYWLLGIRADAAQRALPALLDGISWGGSHVLRQTLDRAERARLKVALTERLADVDRPEDLDLWYDERDRDRAAPLSVSVIVPAIEEADCVGAAVRSALDGGAAEVIVVDGGSTDGTVEAAREAGALVIVAPAGRAAQMNAGAREATGDVLVFLHADTRLPADYAGKVRHALAARGVSGGAFSWGTDDTPLAGLFNWIGRARMALFRLPYGDQALFMRRRTFDDLGGYPEQPVMEDWEFAKRLGRLGTLAVLSEQAITSSRRWNEHGVVRASLRYLAIIAGYRLGMDPEVLDAWRQA